MGFGKFGESDVEQTLYEREPINPKWQEKPTMNEIIGIGLLKKYEK